MKKLVSLLMVLVLVACILPGAVAEEQEGYPAVVEGIDFGGATLHICPYWAPSPRVEDPDEDTQAQYDLRDWIMETYNVNIVEEQVGDWGDAQIQEIQNFLAKGDTSDLRLFIIPGGFLGKPMANGWFADWKNNDLINLTDKMWNGGVIDFATKGDQVFGVATGASEPRQCVFFNKKLLEDAGIDWNTIYDMQKDGTWTWQAFEDLVAQMHKDIDADGVPDIYGMTGDFNDFLMGAVFNNGGSFFDFDENGKLQITAGTDNVFEAEKWAADVYNKYARAQDWEGGEPWNWFVDVFKAGQAAFCVCQTYQGFSDSAALKDMQDEWGCVALPLGPKGDTYYHLISDNITVVPSIYDAETTRNIEYIYSLYNMTPPGVDDSESWIGIKYELAHGDTRAVDETYAMLRESEHSKADKSLYLGNNNYVLGSDTFGNYMWGMRWSSPSSLFDAIKPAWEGLVAVFNGDMTEDEFNKMMEEKKAAEEAAAAEAAAAAETEATEEKPAE